MLRTGLLIFLLLAACAPEVPARVTRDAHTGAISITSRSIPVGKAAQARVMAFAHTVDVRGRRRHGIVTYVARSDLNYPKIAEVWSHGRRLPYTKIDRQRAGRLRAEAGRIALDGAELRALAKTGLSFKMIGPRGHYPVDMPAALFGEVIAQGGG